jgi:hypothetical protein
LYKSTTVGILIEVSTIASIKATLGRIVVATITNAISNLTWMKDIAVKILRIEVFTVNSIEAALDPIIGAVISTAISNL